jgi:DNA-binding LacI/PurR family transcriptional regulator
VEKLRALQEHLIDYGYQAAMTLGKGSEGPRTSGLLKSLCQQRPQGLIWLYTLWRTQEPDLADILEGYVAEGGILVTLDNAVVAPGDQVIFDREHNTYLATKHLLDLGHRDLGLHLGPFGESFHSPRLPGAQRAMREQGLDAERLCRFDSHSLSQYEAGLELAQGYLARSDRPTGMVILNDQTALAFMTAVLAAGVRIPQDVSVVGHDNEPWGAYLPTPLTTVTHPFREVAAAAAALLHDRLRGSQTGPPQRVRVQSDLIIRASTGPPP